MRYARYILRRLALVIPVLFGVTLVVFFLVRLIPGDPVRSLLGLRATDATVAALRAQLGLDEPVWLAYLHFLGRLLRADLGESIFYDTQVSSLVLERLPVTLWLLVAATVLAIIISVPLAVLAASRRGRLTDHMIRAVPLVGLGMPAFWVGVMLILLLGLTFPLFPASGFGDTFFEHVRSIFLPAFTVAIALTPILVRSLRASMIIVLGSDYVLLARAKGLTPRRVIASHALRNAAVYSVTVLGVNVAYLVGTTLVIERVFALPGLGVLMLDAIFNRDFAVIQGVTVVSAVLVITVNVITDLAHAALDPRVKLS